VAFQLFDRLTKDAPLKSLSHMQDHSLRMLNNLVAIEAALVRWRGDLDLLRLAVVLHDVGVFYSQEHCHGPVSAEKIRPHLPDLRLPIGKQDRLCSIIRAHDDEAHIDDSPEANALRILDSLDAFGEIGVYRFLEIYSRRELSTPNMLKKAVESLMRRRASLPAGWFKDEDRAVIHREFRHAYDILRGMEATYSRIEEDNGEMLVLEGLRQIRWDTGRLKELLFDPKFGQNPFAGKYFRDLVQSLASSGI